MKTASITIVPIGDIDASTVEHLLDRAFGPDRHLRTAYRIRKGMAAIAELSFAAIDPNGRLLGTIQCWPIALHLDNGPSIPMVMVGPIAVEPTLQRAGIGKLLTRTTLGAADASGSDPLMLIGDPEYYGRFFGFAAEATHAWQAPGPVERHRLLARGTNIPALPGMLGPRVAVAA